MKNHNRTTTPKIEMMPVESLIPFACNSRTHSDAQVAQIAGSIREFGFTNPVLIDAEDGIIAGHGRVMAARKLSMATVPCLRLSHLTEMQRRAYIIADNKLALNAGWDDAMLAAELAVIKESGVLESTGFSEDELTALGEDDGIYTRKIEAPNYEPKGPKPKLSELIDESKTNAIIEAIKDADLSANEESFLIAAAHRHTVFDFEKIAEFYAHSDRKIQRLMEDSALVIIDFDKAIELGYVKFSEGVRELFTEDNPT